MAKLEINIKTNAAELEVMLEQLRELVAKIEAFQVEIEIGENP